MNGSYIMDDIGEEYWWEVAGFASSTYQVAIVSKDCGGKNKTERMFQGFFSVMIMSYKMECWLESLCRSKKLYYMLR